jgi:hypothetical protein
MTAEPEQAAQYVTLLSREFEGVLNIGRSEPFFVEITAPGVDKADTLSKIISEIGIRHEDVICCGDGFNDKTMIAYAGLGVAMENAQEEVKAVADYITASNDADGIAEVVYKFVMQ